MIRLQQSGQSLGSEILLTIIVRDEQYGEIIFSHLWDKIYKFNNRFSRFLKDSELTKVNLANGKETKVSNEFIELLKEAKRYIKETDGLFNPFILPALQEVGYIGSFPNFNKFDENLDFTKRSSSYSYEDIVIKDNFVTIPKNSALDFGGIGKGYMADKLADYLDLKGIKNYWISLGGDIVCSGRDIDDHNWSIAIAGDKKNLVVDYIENVDGKRLALATSGVVRRKGADWHHLIDPRTLKSSNSNIQIASIAGSSSTATDIFASCLIIDGDKYINKIKGKKGLFKAIIQVREKDQSKIKKYELN